jgi:thioredoxin-like negative regulator of GroEL
VPSPTGFIAWLHEAPRRKKIVGWSIVAAVIIAGVGINGPRLSRAVKGWQARRLTKQSFVLIEHLNWREAGKRIQDAYRIRNTEPEVWRAYARLLSRTGQSGLAVEWWQKLAESRSLSVTDQRDYAGSALAASELAIAAEQVESLLVQPAGPQPSDLLLAAQLATVRGYISTAGKFAERILSDSRSRSSDKLGANLVVLSISPSESQPYKEAFERLLGIARNEQDPASPQALVFLGQQRSPERFTVPTTASLPIALPALSNSPMPLIEIADRLDRNRNSRPFHRMLALEFRARAEPSREEELVAQAVRSYGQGDDETIIALGAWLYSREHFQSMLEILPFSRAMQRRELLMEHIDALDALNRLSEVEEILLAEQPVFEPAFQHMYLAVVRSKLGGTTSSSNEWYRALDAAALARTLIGLADYAEKMSALDIADSAYARLIQKQPGLKSAYLARLRLAQTRGQTALGHDICLEILRLWPEDLATRMREIYLRLLLDKPATQAKAAEEEAEHFLAQNPWDGVARSALALAQLHQGKGASALRTLTEFQPRVPSSAISRSVYAAALASNGWKDKAREEAQKLVGVNILPEERALIAPLLRE